MTRKKPQRPLSELTREELITEVETARASLTSAVREIVTLRGELGRKIGDVGFWQLHFLRTQKQMQDTVLFMDKVLNAYPPSEEARNMFTSLTEKPRGRG